VVAAQELCRLRFAAESMWPYSGNMHWRIQCLVVTTVFCYGISVTVASADVLHCHVWRPSVGHS
jgi:hypothetical protein